MRSFRFFSSWFLSGIMFLGCGGLPVSLSAQRGSTIMIPVAYSNAENVGYEGTGPGFDDPQRGELIFYIEDDATSPSCGSPHTSMSTAAVVLATPSGRSKAGYDRPSGSEHIEGQIIAFVDIPADAPLGLNNIFACIKRDGTETLIDTDEFHIFEEASPGTHGEQIAILPDLIVFADDEGGGEIEVDAAVTPFHAYDNDDWVAITASTIGYIYPDPAYSFELTYDSGSGARSLHGLDFELTYPNDDIDIKGIVEVTEHNATAIWFDADDVTPTGTLNASAARFRKAFAETTHIMVVFELTGATPVSATDFTLTLLSGYDENGDALTVGSSPWSIAAGEKSIK